MGNQGHENRDQGLSPFPEIRIYGIQPTMSFNRTIAMDHLSWGCNSQLEYVDLHDTGGNFLRTSVQWDLEYSVNVLHMEFADRLDQRANPAAHKPGSLMFMGDIAIWFLVLKQERNRELLNGIEVVLTTYRAELKDFPIHQKDEVVKRDIDVIPMVEMWSETPLPFAWSQATDRYKGRFLVAQRPLASSIVSDSVLVEGFEGMKEVVDRDKAILLLNDIRAKDPYYANLSFQKFVPASIDLAETFWRRCH